MARRKFPGAQANLDALCRRFEIDNTHRDLHGALVDADLLAHVYIELLGGRQPGLSLDVEPASPADNTTPDNTPVNFTVESNRSGQFGRMHPRPMSWRRMRPFYND